MEKMLRPSSVAASRPLTSQTRRPNFFAFVSRFRADLCVLTMEPRRSAIGCTFSGTSTLLAFDQPLELLARLNDARLNDCIAFCVTRSISAVEALRRLLFGVGAAGASEGASAEKEMRLAVGVAAISIGA